MRTSTLFRCFGVHYIIQGKSESLSDSVNIKTVKGTAVEPFEFTSVPPQTPVPGALDEKNGFEFLKPSTLGLSMTLVDLILGMEHTPGRNKPVHKIELSYLTLYSYIGFDGNISFASEFIPLAHVFVYAVTLFNLHDLSMLLGFLCPLA